jgi:anti-sigma factor RsiW
VSTTRRRGRGRNSTITRRVDATLRCPVTQRKLMQYHDGELDALPAQKLEHELAWNTAKRRYLETLDAIGEGVRDATRRTTAARELTDQIMARVAAEGFTPKSLASTGLPRPPVSSRLSWRRKITVALGVGLGSTAALAAGALFWLSVGMPSETEAHVTSTPRALEQPPVTDDDSAGGVAIESVDFGMGGGSIFMVQAGQTPTPVVWLTEPPEVEVGSEPL